MKKRVLLLTGLFAFFLGLNTFANNAALFELNETQIEQQFADLTELESIIVDNEGITLSALKSGELNFSPEMKLKVDNLMDGMNLMEPPLGIPSFWWGCVLGWVGILVVYLVSDQDKEETKKALWGCLAWTGVWLLWWVVWVLIVGNSFLFFLNPFNGL